MKWEAAIFAGASLIGLIAGGNFYAHRSDAERGRAETVLKMKSVRTAPEPKWSGGDFVHAARERSARIAEPDFSGMEDELKDWTDDEIRTALEEGMKNPAFLMMGGSAERLANDLYAEWLRRDFDKALAWFSQIGMERVQVRFALTLSSRWPVERVKVRAGLR